ncbi:hypothetical protein ACU686_11700 [Yinghuangia aomiensis]
MGQVFLGESASGRRVAVKARPEIAQDPGFRKRFRREVDLAMKAGGFWTAPVVAADPDAESPWVASQYVPGPALDEHIAAQGPMDEAAVRRLGVAWPRRWTPSTASAWCTATSSRPTSCCWTTGPASSTSASPKPWRTAAVRR